QLIAIAAVVAWPMTATADPVPAPDEPISIQRLVDIAAQQSTTMQLAKQAKRTADLGEVIAGAPAEWQIQAGFNVDRKHLQPGSSDRSPGVAASMLTPPAAGDTTVTASLGLAKQLVTGGTVSLSASGSDAGHDVDGVPAASTRQTSGTAMLSMRQP